MIFRAYLDIDDTLNNLDPDDAPELAPEVEEALKRQGDELMSKYLSARKKKDAA